MHILMPHAANDWPPTYADELFHAQKKNGLYSFTKKGVPHYLLPELRNVIQHCLGEAGHTWGNSMRFLLQVRGMKHTTQHGLGQADVALNQLFREIKIPLQDALGSGTWYVNVGVEFSSVSRDCLQWRTDHHVQMVELALEIDRANAVRITKLGSSQYQRDFVAHLTEVSGCRISTGSHSEGPHGIRSLQLYTTDKALTYSPDNGHYGKYITVSDALAKKQPPVLTTKLRELYIHAMEKNASHCRIEVWVPLAHAMAVLLHFPHNLLESSMLSFPKTVWW